MPSCPTSPSPSLSPYARHAAAETVACTAQPRSPSSPAVGPAVEHPVVLTGDRPTGALHLGHYVGSLATRLALQAEGRHRMFVLVADTQALTDHMRDPGRVSRCIHEVALDYLAVGLDPARTTMFVQSCVPELAELSMLMLNLVSVSRLERNPTIRNEIRLRGFERDVPAGFLVYPAAQAADIAAFRARYVPVGEDQLPMIEQTNELVSKMNAVCGEDVLVPCEPLLSSTGRLPGVDGRGKMSKSQGNAIALAASPDEIRRAVQQMYTDPGHLRVSDPGRVEGNVVFSFLDAFDADATELDALKAHYRRGGLGDMALKRRLTERLIAFCEPIRARRLALERSPDYVRDVLRTGSAAAREEAARTVGAVKRSLGLPVF